MLVFPNALANDIKLDKASYTRLKCTHQNPGFVNIETAAVIQDDFEHGVPPAKYLQGQQGLAVRKIESISKR